MANKVLEATPVMESFGNAKTVRNDNSSRFGKWVEVSFGVGGMIRGASITSYLLEKSRIAHHSPGERNYHVFYELCSRLSENTEEVRESANNHS